MRPKEYILLAASVVMICMLIIPKIISYERHHALPPIYRQQFDPATGIKSGLDQFQVDNGHFPKSVQELVQRTDDATNWHGPYLDPAKLPIDPWGHPYIYYFPGRHNTNGYDLLSVGPDGKEGTADDVGNWMN